MDDLSKQYGTYHKQADLLQMMKDIDALLKRVGVKYSLCGGSLLGAIRNNGFIPWDDDIDIMVDRGNYNLLKEKFGQISNDSEYVLGRYLWVDRIQKKGCSANDLTSPTIDVFVMDNCPNNICTRMVKVILIALLQGMMKKDIDYKQHSLPYRVCLGITNLVGKPFSDERKFKWYSKVSSIGNKKKTKYITGYNDAFGLLKLKYTGKLFDLVVEHQFEDTTFPITSEYDNYLRTQYGDYMIPPPEEDRKPHYTALK